MDNYYNIPRVSNSALGYFKKSPKHYWMYMNGVYRKDDDALNFGRLAHFLVLEPDNFHKEYIVLKNEDKPNRAKDFRDSENKAWKLERQEFARINKFEIVDEANYTIASDMAYAFYEQLPKMFGGLAGADIEVCKFFEIDGIECKSKADVILGDMLIDYKTTKSAEPKEFNRSFFNFDYHRQAAFYTDAYKTKDCYYIAQEKEYPYMISVHRIAGDVIDYGRKEYLALLEGLKICNKTGVYPGYEFKEPIFAHFDITLPNYLI